MYSLPDDDDDTHPHRSVHAFFHPLHDDDLMMMMTRTSFCLPGDSFGAELSRGSDLGGRPHHALQLGARTRQTGEPRLHTTTIMIEKRQERKERKRCVRSSLDRSETSGGARYAAVVIDVDADEQVGRELGPVLVAHRHVEEGAISDHAVPNARLPAYLPARGIVFGGVDLQVHEERTIV